MSHLSERQELPAYAARARHDLAAARATLAGDSKLLEPSPTKATFTSTTWGKSTLIVWTMIPV